MPPSPQSELAAQRAQFDRDGFLVLRDVLEPELVACLIAAADRLAAEGAEWDGLSERRHWQRRNCLPCDPVFLDLLDHQRVLPVVAAILGWSGFDYVVIDAEHAPFTLESMRSCVDALAARPAARTCIECAARPGAQPR